MFETGLKKTEKRKKFKENDASNIDGFLGPWAKYVDEKEVAKPSEVRTFFFVFLNQCRMGIVSNPLIYWAAMAAVTYGSSLVYPHKPVFLARRNRHLNKVL